MLDETAIRDAALRLAAAADAPVRVILFAWLRSSSFVTFAPKLQLRETARAWGR